MNLTQQLTLIIPTKNRKKWIERVFRYYNDVNFKGNIILADSSDQYKPSELIKLLNETNTIIDEEFYSRIKIIRCPKLRAEQAILKALKYVQTNYVVVVNDDDIILSKYLLKGLKFLEKNKDHAGFIGKSFSISTKSDQPFCKDITVTNYNLFNSSKSSAIDRCVDYLLEPANCVMVVMATSLAIKAFSFSKYLHPYHQHFIFGEIMHGLIVCNEGKIKSFNFSYCVRQNHSNNEYNNLDFYKFISVKTWPKTHNLLKKTLLLISKKSKSSKKKINLDIILNQFYRNLVNNILKNESKNSYNLKTLLKNMLIVINSKFPNPLTENMLWYSKKLSRKKIKIDNDLYRYINIIKLK